MNGAPPSRQLLARNLAAVRDEIAAACARAGRSPGSVELLAVVKYVGPELVRLLIEAGVVDLGEGTVQGALAKREPLADLKGLRWHLVGRLQRNKARKAAGLFASIHSLDSLPLARKLEEALAELEEPDGPEPAGTGPRLYLEVNVAAEPQKGGVSAEEVEPLLRALGGETPRVARRLAGLMAMAPYSDDPQAARPHFRRLRELRDRLEAAGLLPQGGLSMGMSGDYPVAVEEGATVVRVGTRIFEGLAGRTPARLGERP